MTLWYAARAFGMVSVVLLSAVLVLGLLVSARRRPLLVLTGLHRSLSLLAVVFVATHVAAAVADGYVSIGWTDAFVPFASSYHPLWLGLGAVALDLVVALIVTSLLRARLGLRFWKAVHWLAYAAWPVAVAHGIGVGTDSALVLGLTAVNVTAVATALVARLRRRPPNPTPRTTPAAVARTTSGYAARTALNGKSETPPGGTAHAASGGAIGAVTGDVVRMAPAGSGGAGAGGVR
ncbi:ferric reductase-like transmembrane domain-containing protein [Actinomadura fibrosa]|uniref:Ferric reductase-like transmembrane domain-containing protein n=1 Tax=Actinomadura fibrosa TaxID=111802 RepID=A0ABW2XVA3_9ACTN|nr:ferric reductase-like transmembrane domain-containing protein [Actinomadura fibrosa]